MDSLTELCDILAQNTRLASDKIGWIWSRCPPPGSLRTGSHRLTNSQLNAVLAIARFLSLSPNRTERSLLAVILEFLEALPLYFNEDFWPKSFGLDAVANFFSELLKYLVKIADSNEGLCAEVSGVIAGLIQNNQVYYESSVSRAFLSALAQNCPRFESADVEKISACLLEQWIVPTTTTTSSNTLISSSSDTSSQSSPYDRKQYQAPFLNGVSSPIRKMKGKEEYREGTDDNMSASSKAARMNGGSGTAGRSSLDQLALTSGYNDGGAALKQQITAFEEESVEALEKQEIAFRLLGHVLDKGSIKDAHLQQLRIAAGKQLKALPTFLKIRKRDWPEQGVLLKTRINTKLSVCQAAAVVQTKGLLLSDLDGKATKTLLRETLALLLDAADACVVSSWRKLRTCEELFSSLLSGVAQAAITRGSQVLRVLLLRLKALVLMTCAQADTWGNSQGAMFESVIKTSCDIIAFGWNKDRAPIESFILALAANIRERVDFGEQEEREKQVVPLVVIRLLADMAVSLNKPEVVEMILPLFIESLEEGDASTPSLLRLRLLDAVARMASLGFEKSYRETVVLLTRSYLDKLSTVGSTQSRTLAPEATTERVETLPTAFLSVACGLTDSKLRSDFRHRLLALCSDVGLAAESKSGSMLTSQKNWKWKANSDQRCNSRIRNSPKEKFCKLNTWQRAPHTSDVVSLLSEIRLVPGKTDCWNGIRTANVPAVIAAAAAASGANLKMAEACNLEVLSTAIVSANVKSNYAGEIAGMRRLYVSIGGFQPQVTKPNSDSGSFYGLSNANKKLRSSSEVSHPENESFNEMLVTRFVRLLQQFVNTAEKGGVVDKASFHETCSQATALLLSDLDVDSKVNLEGFSQLLRLLCWCPAYISTPAAMETGVFVWTWLVSAAPHLGSLVLAELVDAWLWTVDTKRGLFAAGIENSGPAAKLRPHLTPGEPGLPPEKNPVEGITAHRLWLGFFLDRFEVVRHDSIEQLLLLGRMLQGSMKSPSHFSFHPAATGAFFTLMLLGLKFCSCQFQNNLQNCGTGLHLLEDRVYRESAVSRSKISSERWAEYVKTSFSVDPRIALSLVARFPSVSSIRAEVASLVQLDSGIPLQSAAKVPIMITFNVTDKDGDPKDLKPQACIFKVGDDCQQDVLALQVISLLRDIFDAVGLNLYLFPYGVLPTGHERGIIEVVPNTRSRNQMGEITDGGLYEIFQQEYGPVGSLRFEEARDNFIISSAGYAVASLLLQPKDRHNGNLLFDNIQHHYSLWRTS